MEKKTVYKISIVGPMCPHCHSKMRTLEPFVYRCTICHSAFQIDSDECEKSEVFLGSKEIFCQQIYGGEEE